jgi:large subunit ribosomal protein L25
MNAVAIKGQLRETLGKKGAKSFRAASLIPAVLYGGDEVVHFAVSDKDIRPLVYTADFHLAKVEVNGNTYRCLVKDVQFHPVTDAILHVDFLRLIDGQPVKVEIPVRFSGVSPGVKAGGKLQQKVRRVKIKALPEHLVDELVIDISHLKLGQSIRVRDIPAKENIEILNSPGIPVATIEIPRALRSATAAADKGK